MLGVADRARDRAESLSLGNQQRVQLAAALVHRPEVLVLDEPFSGLDPVGVDVLSAILRRQAEDGAPVVFSSHQLELVERLCESVVMIDRGRIVASGRLADLRARDTRRLVRVEVAGAPERWLDRVPGGGRDRRARQRERVGRARRGTSRGIGQALQRHPAEPVRDLPP
jgi:ABC-2 type transport system ATP-binding protein